MSNKMRIYIWGLGVGLETVLDSIDTNQVIIEGLIDNYIKESGQKIKGYAVLLPNQMDETIDYIIISAMLKFNEIKKQALTYGYKEDQIICYYDKYDFKANEQISFLNSTLRTCKLVELEIQFAMKKIDNLEYEIADKIRNNEYQFPIVKTAEACLERIIEKRCSLCRYGDGEFEMMQGRLRLEYQSPDVNLGRRLKDIIKEEREDLLVAIADNYGSLEKYTEKAKLAIRKYMSSTTRLEHMSLLDLKREYYNAYVSRPYVIHKDKTYATKIFNLWKKVWENRDVVIVEGELTRSGYKNDLFDNTNSIGRILCAQKNVWKQYDEILKYILENISKEKLILIVLGPTATILAYDLSAYGYQAIDLGQVDNEYEWYKKDTGERINVSYKYMSECGRLGQNADADVDDEFLSQIMVNIGC